LGEAVEKITLVWKNDYQNKIPRPVVAQHAGYKSMNGRALSVLASLSKYGLLDGRGEENWVSDLALEIIAHPPKSPERAKAVKEAADLPDLFREISERFPGGVSEVALKSYLLTKKFIPDAADIVTRCYRETKQFLIDEGVTYNTSHSENEEVATVRQSGPQVVENTGGFITRFAPQDHTRAASTISYPASGVAVSVALNEPKVYVEGDTMRIEAWVNAKGLKRLQKMIAANAPLREADDDDPHESAV